MGVLLRLMNTDICLMSSGFATDCKGELLFI